MEKQRSEEAKKQRSGRSREAKNYKSKKAGKRRKAKKQGNRNQKKTKPRDFTLAFALQVLPTLLLPTKCAAGLLPLDSKDRKSVV